MGLGRLFREHGRRVPFSVLLGVLLALAIAPAAGASLFFETKWGSNGVADGQFEAPEGITANASNVYVADTGNDRVQRFDRDGNSISTWGGFGTANGSF